MSQANPTVQDGLNYGNPNSLPEMCRRVSLGNVLSALDTMFNQAVTHEVVAVAANTGVLSAPAAAILGIDARAGTTTGVLSMMADDATLVTKSCKLALDGKTLSFFGTDAVTSCVVSYRKNVLPALAAILAASP